MRNIFCPLVACVPVYLARAGRLKANRHGRERLVSGYTLSLRLCNQPTITGRSPVVNIIR